MSRDQWPPLQRAVDALRARAEHGTVMPFGRRKAARILAELQRLEALVERPAEAVEPAHRLDVWERDDEDWTWRCSCGAWGASYTVEVAAQEAADEHVAEAAEPADDPFVEAPGFGVTNRSYWPRSWVRAQEAEDADRAHGYGDFTPPGKGSPRCTCKCGATSGPVESDLAAQQWWAQHRTEAEEVTRRP